MFVFLYIICGSKTAAPKRLGVSPQLAVGFFPKHPGFSARRGRLRFLVPTLVVENLQILRRANASGSEFYPFFLGEVGGKFEVQKNVSLD